MQIKREKYTNLVKKNLSYWFLVFAILCCGTVNAKVNSFVGAFANIGEWSLLPSGSEYGASLGVAGGGGFIYELQAYSKYSSPAQFLFQVGVGATGGMTSFRQSNEATAVLKDQFDLEGERFDYVYDLRDRHDEYRDVALQIPLMFGVQYGKFYLLAGAKVYSHIYTKSRSTGLLNTYGRYEDFDDFTGMPEYQFFSDIQLPLAGQKSPKTSMKLDIDASLEIGGRLGLVANGSGFDVPKRNIEYRLAGFVDYGLLDVHYSMDKPQLGTLDGNGATVPLEGNLSYNSGATYPVYNTESMIQNLVLTDIMSTKGFASKVNNFVVGVKFTIMFRLPEQKRCVMCADGYVSSARSGGGSRGMKYEE